MSNTITRTEFNNATAEQQAKLKAAGIQIVEDTTTSVVDDIFNEQPASATSSKWDDNVYLNIDLVVGDKHLRISGVRLDSDYVQYLDKEHTKVNNNAASLLASINKVGVAQANEKANFAVTITKQGESSAVKTDSLFD